MLPFAKLWDGPRIWETGKEILQMSWPQRPWLRTQKRIREFLKVRTSYDVMPLSFRLIVFDTALLVKSSLAILIQNGMNNLHVNVDTQFLTMGLNKFEVLGIVSAPLWDSKTSTFAGLLTTSDYLNLIQYYWQTPEAVNRIDQFRLNSLRGKILLWERTRSGGVCGRNWRRKSQFLAYSDLVFQISKRLSVWHHSRQYRFILFALSMKHVAECWRPVRGVSIWLISTMRPSVPWWSA